MVLDDKSDFMKKWNKITTPLLFIGPGVLLILVFMVYPILFSFDISLKNFNFTSVGSQIYWNNFQNYTFILKDPVFWTSVNVTMIFSLFTVVFSSLFALGLAVLLSAIQRRWRQVLGSFILAPVAVCPVVAGLLFKNMFIKNQGIVDYILNNIFKIPTPNWLADPNAALWTVIIVGIWMAIPLNTLIILAALQGVPEEIKESTLIDGANSIQRFFYITLPYIKLVIGAVVLMSTINAIKEFDMVYSLTSGGPGVSTLTMTYYANNVGFQIYDLGRAAAASTLIFLIIIVATLVISGLFFMRRDDNDL